jgi:hypothetical protein
MQDKKQRQKERGGMVGIYKFTLEDINTGKKTVRIFRNIITIAGRAAITNNMADPTPDSSLLVTHAALGSNATGVSENDVKLGTETYRNDIASRTSADNIFYGTAFFSAAEYAGTIKEAGIFMDGEAGADTGVLLSHVNTDIVKTLTQKLTIDWTLTITNA